MNIGDIKTRMKVIADTRKITGAMETVSIAKTGKALQRYEQNSEYFERLCEVMSDMVRRTSSWVHPCFRRKGGGRTLMIVISSDKGLIGGFNHNILEYANAKAVETDCPTIIAIGETCKEYFEKKKCTVVNDFTEVSFNPTIDDADDIAEYIYKEFIDSDLAEAYIVYTGYETGRGASLQTTKLLPITKSDICSSDGLREENDYPNELYYEPSAEEVLEKLVPQYLSGVIYGCLLQSSAAEHSARRAAMNVATNNADDLLCELKKDLNRARQNAVTSEITDIITAVSGVKDE